MARREKWSPSDTSASLVSRQAGLVLPSLVRTSPHFGVAVMMHALSTLPADASIGELFNTKAPMVAFAHGSREDGIP
jgi:hypothetical protein